MADDQIAVPTEFHLDVQYDFTVNAKDMVRSLDEEQIINLIAEIDGELGSQSFIVKLKEYVDEQFAAFDSERCAKCAKATTEVAQ